MRRLAWVVGAVLMAALPLVAQQSEWNPDKAAEEAQRPEHPVTVAQVHQIMALTKTNDLKKQMLESMMPYLKQAMPFLPPDVLDDYQARIEKADFEPIAIASYQKHLSTEDAAQVIAFYESPAGKRIVAAMPQIVAETQQAGAVLGQKLMAETLEAHRAEIETAIRKYRQEHAGAAAQH